MKMKIAVAALAILLAPALALAQKTSYDFDKTIDFTAFKTYGLKDGTKVGQTLIDDRIVAAIEGELAAKGFTKSDRTPTSSSCITSPSTSRRTSRPTAPATPAVRRVRLGMGRRLGGGTTTTQVRDILVGTLIIDIADAKKSQLPGAEWA